MLEKLLHSNAVLPSNQHFVRITIPNGVSYEVFPSASHPGWDSRDEAICKAFGDAWCREKRTALLLVPSIPARVERNIIVNPVHPDAQGITHDLPEPVWWDERLYAPPRATYPRANSTTTSAPAGGAVSRARIGTRPPAASVFTPAEAVQV